MINTMATWIKATKEKPAKDKKDCVVRVTVKDNPIVRLGVAQLMHGEFASIYFSAGYTLSEENEGYADENIEWFDDSPAPIPSLDVQERAKEKAIAYTHDSHAITDFGFNKKSGQNEEATHYYNGYKDGALSSQPAGNFLKVLEENQVANEFTKTDSEPWEGYTPYSAVAETYEDLIAIWKTGSWLAPSTQLTIDIQKIASDAWDCALSWYDNSGGPADDFFPNKEEYLKTLTISTQPAPIDKGVQEAVKIICQSFGYWEKGKSPSSDDKSVWEDWLETEEAKKLFALLAGAAYREYNWEELKKILLDLAFDVNTNGYGGHSTAWGYIQGWWNQNKHKYAIKPLSTPVPSTIVEQLEKANPWKGYYGDRQLEKNYIYGFKTAVTRLRELLQAQPAVPDSKVLVDGVDGLVKDQAIAFAEWMEDNEFVCITDWDQKTKLWKPDGQAQAFTTESVYNLFNQSKEETK